jgi:GNAT superfamily N-acetyltransferase
MSFPEHIKLDNPAWYSLQETHHYFAIGNHEIKFYRPDICPFGGLATDKADFSDFLRHEKRLQSFFVIGNTLPESEEIIGEYELVCLQMLCPVPPSYAITERVTVLTEQHKEQLTALVNLVQPGYFLEGTRHMGDYFGIFKENKLVAVTGERMKMKDYTEISAVVTHPDFTGRGFARQLVAYTACKIFRENKLPYLHVAAENSVAIRLYQSLGFVLRKKISFWKMKRK